MYRRSILLPLLVSIASGRPSHQLSLASRQIPTGPCATGIHVIAAGGDGARNIGQYGLIGSLSDGLLNAIPGSSSVEVPYPKGEPNGGIKIGQGSELLRTYIDTYHDTCPDTKIVLLGYSAGAYIAMNNLCGGNAAFSTPAVDDSYADFIIGSIIYGDLTFLAGQPYNRGTCTKSGRFPRTNPEECAPFSQHILSFCDDNDPQCCDPGFDAQVHFDYPAKYDGTSIEYIAARYQETLEQALVIPQPEESVPEELDEEPMDILVDPATIPDNTEDNVPVNPEAPQDLYPSPDELIDPAPTDPEHSQISTPEQTTTTECPLDLIGPFEFPHLILPISSQSPSTPAGTSYNGLITSTTSSIFNFDIPPSAVGKTCTLSFFLPRLDDLTTSSYTISGTGGLNAALLDEPATEGATFNSRPSIKAELGVVTVVEGGAVALASGPCEGGKRVGYLLSSEGDFSLEWFQNMGEPPVGLFVRVC